VVDTTAVSRSPLSGVADNNKFFCGWQKMGIYLESPLSFVEECNSRLAQIAEAYKVMNDEEKCLVDYDMVLQYVYSIQKILKWILVEQKTGNKTFAKENMTMGRHCFQINEMIYEKTNAFFQKFFSDGGDPMSTFEDLFFGGH